MQTFRWVGGQKSGKIANVICERSRSMREKNRGMNKTVIRLEQQPSKCRKHIIHSNVFYYEKLNVLYL